MDKKSIAVSLGFMAIGALTTMATKKVINIHRLSKVPPNPWERAWAIAELIPYNPLWGIEKPIATSQYFTNIHDEVDLSEMRVYKTTLPTGIRALLVVSMFNGPMAIYQTDLNAKTYMAIGNPAIMNRRIDNVSVFIGTIPAMYLTDVCDPTSAIYVRNEFDGYYNFHPQVVKRAAKNDGHVMEFIQNLLEVIGGEEFNLQVLSETIIPDMIKKYFPHYTVEVVVEEDDIDVCVGLKIGEQIDIKVIENGHVVLEKHITEVGPKDAEGESTITSTTPPN